MLLYRFLIHLLMPIFYFFYRIRVTGKENITDGAAVVCCNHTSLLDPPMLAIAFGASYPLSFMAKKELFDTPIMGWFLKNIGAFSINRGNADITAIRDSIAMLKSGKKVMLFPEGTRVKESDEGHEPVKTGVALLAVRAGVPIIPVYMSGSKGLFRKTYINIGKAIYPQKTEGSASENYQRIANNVFDVILSLGTGNR